MADSFVFCPACKMSRYNSARCPAAEAQYWECLSTVIVVTCSGGSVQGVDQIIIK